MGPVDISRDNWEVFDMIRITWLSCALSAVMFAGAALADAPPPAAIAQQCVQDIGESTQASVAAMQHRTQVGVARIAHLDEQDAPAPVIVASAHASRHAVNQAATNGVRAANGTAFACLWVLDAIDSPDGPKQIVLAARQQSITVIGNVREQANLHISEALMQAIGAPSAVMAF